MVAAGVLLLQLPYPPHLPHPPPGLPQLALVQLGEGDTGVLAVTEIPLKQGNSVTEPVMGSQN